MSTIAQDPLLKRLPPSLRGLAQRLRLWLEAPHRFAISTQARSTLTSLASDLTRQADALDVDKPLLVIMLMGGTGVGKSSLLNALAGSAIAQASFTRPTTRDPVVYYPQTLQTSKLDPALQHCRLVPHDRASLEQKVLVDTPDLDSNDLANREKLLRLLPIADVVLYVGSQEKYHDKLGWDLFLQQKERRAFAFVLNKWDRCTRSSQTGMRPDDDLLRDVQESGFTNPLLFRTCAQHWLDKQAGQPTPPLPEGEQFTELVHWLETGLTKLEIAAIKTRGVQKLLAQLHAELGAVLPPDLREVAQRTSAYWQTSLVDEAFATTDALLYTLEPFQKEIEHHFALQGQSRFRGMMAIYLRFITGLKYFGSQLRERLPGGTTSSTASSQSWNLATFTQASSDLAAQRSLTARAESLVNRLLVQADGLGFPLELLNEKVEAIAKEPWRTRFSQALTESLQQVEAQWTKPTGFKSVWHLAILLLADWLPLLALLGMCGVLLWRYLVERQTFETNQLLLPAVVVLLTLVLLHVLITVLMPLRWANIRNEFHRELSSQLKKQFLASYQAIPHEVANTLQAEREELEQTRAQVSEMQHWLQESEERASVVSLFSN